MFTVMCFLLLRVLLLHWLTGGYQDDHATVKMFWSIMSTFSEEEKRKFLFFVTSCSRPPLLGFKVGFKQ